ncbi:hypothetical protein N0V83_004166 [Neocucurbitaria cava]|uniref:Uncharacterized protein n=1 Tax=Neocucurbitaria cava TaxID=798079 RepID=A0A9W8YAT6_9PLEO|nr:hypothetical protein N0V83_004166 [Neocucurbitaria cava]
MSPNPPTPQSLRRSHSTQSQGSVTSPDPTSGGNGKKEHVRWRLFKKRQQKKEHVETDKN